YLSLTIRPLRFRYPLMEWARVWIVLAGPDFGAWRHVAGRQDGVGGFGIPPGSRRHHAAMNHGVALADGQLVRLGIRRIEAHALVTETPAQVALHCLRITIR